jgi:hypothetical protein
MTRLRIGWLIPLLIVVWGSVTYLGPVSADEEQQRTYIGAEKCKICHKKPDQGEQYGIWKKGPHAKAYETLANEKSKEIAKGMGIDNPQESPKCLKCHVTAHGVDAKFLGPKYEPTEGVSCESCHGAGGDYYKMKVMKGLRAGEIEPQSVGLTIPNEKVCVTCHNEESPTYKEFDFAARAKEIAHPIPEKTE